MATLVGLRSVGRALLGARKGLNGTILAPALAQAGVELGSTRFKSEGPSAKPADEAEGDDNINFGKEKPNSRATRSDL